MFAATWDLDNVLRMPPPCAVEVSRSLLLLCDKAVNVSLHGQARGIQKLSDCLASNKLRLPRQADGICLSFVTSLQVWVPQFMGA